MKFHRTHLTGSIMALVATFAIQPFTTQAAEIIRNYNNPWASGQFGWSTSVSGTMSLTSDPRESNENTTHNSAGALYIHRNLDTATGPVSESVRLFHTFRNQFHFLGASVSLSGTMGLAGAPGGGYAGLYRNLDTATGTISQNATLLSSDGAGAFGRSASLSGTTGLIGADSATIGANSGQGAAYVFRNLDTATGNVNQNAKLTASDGAANDNFGYSSSLSGTTGLVGAYNADVGANANQGAAYIFRGLNTATGTNTQNAKLTASDGGANDNFGISASLSGTTGIVGASFGDGATTNQGAAYVFRNLDTATGTNTQNAKLVASDGAANDFFGESVAVSGSTALVGARGDDGVNFTNQGAAYLFRGLDTATGTISESVKITATGGGQSPFTPDHFGGSVALDGDLFVIGAASPVFGGSGSQKAVSGSVGSLTTLDSGSTSRTISGLSFVSKEDWIIGETTDSNSVTLASGNSANITAAGKAVYIGKNAGSDNNRLTINGTLTANSINVGAVGNTGNTLVVNSSISGTTVTVSGGGTLTGTGTVGSLTVGNGGTISPGNSPGNQVVAGNLTWLAGGNYNWQTLNTVGTPGTQWDLISATGVLNLSALTVGSEFNINLWSLASTGPDVNGNIANFNSNLPYQWLIATAAGGITGFTGSNQFVVNTGAFNGTSGFSNPFAGSFNVSRSGNNLFLNYDAPPLPEPGTWAVGALLVTGAAATAWRRRTRGQTA